METVGENVTGNFLKEARKHVESDVLFLILCNMQSLLQGLHYLVNFLPGKFVKKQTRDF